MKAFQACIVVFTFCMSLAHAHKTPVGHKNTITFTKNKNQWDARVLYRADLDGGVLFLEKDAFTYSLYDKEKRRKIHTGKTDSLSLNIKYHAYKMVFKNANSEGACVTEEQRPASSYTNYYIGNDPKNWASHVESFQQVNYKSLYPKIDLEIIGQENSVKYNFMVAPDGDPNKIIMEYQGIEAPTLHEGRLILKNSLNEIVEEKPYAYQKINGKKVQVPCHFKVSGQQVSFEFEEGYNHSYPLVIDPTLIFCSYSGSYADNFGMTATYDSHGNFYAGGTAFDQGYPVTLGAYDTFYNGIVDYGRTDVVITKYDSTGSKLIYSTYLGGATGSEIVTSLIVNDQDELFAYGATGSSDFPTSSNAFSKTFKGGDTLRFTFNGTYFDQGTDIYLARFNVQGTQLLASTYIGGSKNDGVNHNNKRRDLYFPCYTNLTCILPNEYTTDSLQYNYGDQYRGEIMLDHSGYCYIASSTRSPDFPIVNGFDKTLGGQQDAVICKFNSDLSRLSWSTYLGGQDNDAGYSLAVDDSSVVYVTGGTRSFDFPTTLNSLNPNYLGGKADGYITKINKNGTAILGSTLVGTSQYDQSYFVQLDKARNVYLYGQTAGTFPVTPGVYSNPNSGQFIIKLNNVLNSVIYSTVFGNGRGINISPSAFLVDNCENVYISGWGGDFIQKRPTYYMPLTPDAFQKDSTDGFNFYLMVLSKNVKSLIYGTYFGGKLSTEHVDGGTSRFDKKGIIYQSVCAGCGGHSDLPTTPGAWSRTNNSKNCNNGTIKMDFGFKLVSSNFLSSQQGCSPLLVNFKNVSSSRKQYFWDFGNNDTTSRDPNPTRSYSAPGRYIARLIVTDPLTCNLADTSFKFITVYPAIKHQQVTINPTKCFYTCDGSASISPFGGSPPFKYQWSSGQNTPFVNNLCAGMYKINITDSLNCKDSAVATITRPAKLSSSVSITDNPCKKPCFGAASVFVSGGISPYKYLWNSGQTSSTANALCKGNFIVQVEDANLCKDTVSFNISDAMAFAVRVSSAQALCNGICNGRLNGSGFGGRQPYSYLWNNGFNQPTLVNQCAGNYFLKASDANGCKDSINIALGDSLKLLSRVSAIKPRCGKKCDAQAMAELTGGTAPYSYLWNDPKFQKTQTATQLCNGKYNVRLGDSKGCLKKDSITIKYSSEFPVIHASVEKDTLYEGQSTFLHVTNGYKYIYLWAPGTGLSSTNSIDPIASPVVTTTYKVSVQDSVNCESRDSVTIFIKKVSCTDPEVFIPNGFSPNDDGNNDILYVRGRTIEEMYLAVYDRWGEKMFESTSPLSGWDGRYKGAYVTPAVYAYYLRVRCVNKKEFFKKGNITVIR